MDIHREIADQYQGPFNLMRKEHNLILTISEMDEIIIESQKVQPKIDTVNTEYIIQATFKASEKTMNENLLPPL